MKRSERARHKELTSAWDRLQAARTIADQAAWFEDACTAYPPRSDRESHRQVLPCSRCGMDVVVPVTYGPVPRFLFFQGDHACTVTALSYIYNDETDPSTRCWVIIWVSIA